jgi:hypothetical protein
MSLIKRIRKAGTVHQPRPRGHVQAGMRTREQIGNASIAAALQADRVWNEHGVALRPARVAR